MPAQYPAIPHELLDWTWAQFAPIIADLKAAALTEANIAEWLGEWSRLSEHLDELYSRLYVGTTVNTADEDMQQRYNRFLDEIYPSASEAEQALKQKLLESGLEPAGFGIQLRNLRAEAELFRPANIPLMADQQKFGSEYDKIVGSQTVEWEGKEITLPQLRPVLQSTDRGLREQAWRLSLSRQLEDRDSINQLWQKLLGLRLQLAANAGESDFRSFRWKQLLRFEYTPADCEQFHRAIEEVVVPAASRIYDRRKAQLNVTSLRPWDLDVDPLGRSPLKPFAETGELKRKAAAIFHNVDPQIGAYFDQMLAENLLDLDNRKNKAPGGYCISFPASHRPFIFMNAVGLHQDVQTLLHEGGHSFHDFEAARLPYYSQRAYPAEFAEVASMGMELLASPYLTDGPDGFYSAADAARAIIEHLESSITIWPYIALVDAFQHWVYTHPTEASDPTACDQCWTGLWQRFMPGVDWSGLETEMATGWQRKLHIIQVPFYYIEYGLAQLGAVQVWRNSLVDQKKAITQYLQALALGATRPLPELFQAAGARLAFDTATLAPAVELIENTIHQLEKL